MITLLTHPDGPLTSRQTVLLDITIKDVNAPPDEACDLFKEAQWPQVGQFSVGGNSRVQGVGKQALRAC